LHDWVTRVAATLYTVAALAKVSVKTVSNVVNDQPYVRAETKIRVQAAIVELGYVPNQTARSLRSGKTDSLTLAVPELGVPYFAELAQAVVHCADSLDQSVVIEQTGGDRDRELLLLRSPRRNASDGLIFSPLGMTQYDKTKLKVDYPLVILGEQIVDGPTDHVTMQNSAAAEAATNHLISRGRRRIAVIGAHRGEVVGTAAFRLDGHQRSLERARIPRCEDLILYEERWHRANGAHAAQRLLSAGIEFDAIFAMNDTLALGALRVVQGAGFQVPADVAIIGFDNIDETKYSSPALSTVDPGVAEIAKKAVGAVMLRGLKTGRDARPQTMAADFRLVIREST
jgi:DNA-binding LacI/PurR family transcriptional regulator